MAKPNSNTVFYVYVHRRATDGRVFYVGKGHKRRAYEFRRRNVYWNRIKDRHGVIVEIVIKNLTNDQASSNEIDLIAHYGRENLCNLTDGGEGTTGRKIPDESVKRMADSKRGKKLSKEHVEKIRITSTGRTHTEESKRKIAESNSRRKLHTSSFEKMRLNMPHRREIESSDGVRHNSIGDAIKYLKMNGWPKASDSAIIRCCKNKQNTAYGLSWRYI